MLIYSNGDVHLYPEKPLKEHEQTLHLALPLKGRKKEILSCHVTKLFVKNQLTKVLIV